MNDRQKAFVDEYMKDRNATQAATRAGYAHPHVAGPRLLGNVGVKAAIQERMKAVSDEALVDAAWVVERLKMEAAREGEGSSHSARVSALEKLGKHIGMFVDRVDHSGTLHVEGAEMTFVRPDPKTADR